MGTQTVQVNIPDGKYLNSFMRKDAFIPLATLFAMAHAPAKEITESYAALVHLGEYLRTAGPVRVIHIGDGAHARTAALFAFTTHAENIAVDPATNEGVVQGWRDRWNVQRFEWMAARIETAIPALNALPPMRTLVTLVHAHVNTDEVLARLRWDVAYTMACCHPDTQLSRGFRVLKSGEDWSCLAHQRRYQVLAPERIDASA